MVLNFESNWLNNYCHSCRCFLPPDIWFLGNPAWCEEQSQMEMRFIMVRALGKRVKAVRLVATLVLLVFGKIAITI